MEEARLLYWTYNKLLGMLALCILLLGVWIFVVFNLLIVDETAKITGIMFVVSFVVFGSYIWEKRESWNKELNN